MSLKDEFLSDAEPGVALNMVNTELDYIQDGMIGTRVIKTYKRSSGASFAVEKFYPRGPAPSLPPTTIEGVKAQVIPVAGNEPKSARLKPPVILAPKADDDTDPAIAPDPQPGLLKRILGGGKKKTKK